MLDGDEYIENWDEYFLEMMDRWEKIAEQEKAMLEDKQKADVDKDLLFILRSIIDFQSRFLETATMLPTETGHVQSSQLKKRNSF